MRDRARWRNWGRNQQCNPAAVEAPTSELEVVEAVQRAKRAGQTVKVVGAGHSFTGIACTDGRMLRLGRLNRIVAMDRDAGTVTVEGGIPLWQLNDELETRDLALPNLGDIDRQSISGAIATATHGGGKGFGGLATFVTALEIVTADGEVLRCSRDEEPEVFACARVGLGALGAGGIGKTEVVDVSHRVLCSRRLVRFVEMEYAIPRAELGKTLLRVRDLIEGEGLAVNFPIELRVAAADDIPLSTASGRETGYLAVHLSAGTPFDQYFRGVEAIMDDVGGRPHWGKMHYQTAETLAPRYPEWARFQAVRARLDPEGRFRNPYLDRVLGPVASP